MKKLILAFLLIPSVCFAEPIISEEYNFGLGVNYDQIATDIDPAQSPDMCDCISDQIGATMQRNGTERFNSQAFSSYPVTSLYWIYASTGLKTVGSMVGTNKDSIIYSTGGVSPQFTKVFPGITEYTDWKWIGNQNRAIGLGGLENDIVTFDPITNTVASQFSQEISSNALKIRAKYGIVLNDYLILANVAVATWATPTADQWSYYPSRIYYSKLMVEKTSTFTLTRYIDFATDDGEGITGVGSLYGVAHIFKPSKIGELTFTILDLPSAGGDWVFSQLINNFGLKSPGGISNVSLSYVMPSNDGIRTWNGSRQTRLQIAEESRLISDDGIKTVINKAIRDGTYENSVGFYYEKKNWYVFAYEDKGKHPEGVKNSILIYDFRIGNWFPFCGINASSFAQDKDGNLYYGDSNDGYIYNFDKFRRANDARKEMVVDVMDSSTSWTGSTIDRANVIEGTASLKISIDSTTVISTMTLMKQFNFGEWPDKKNITSSDKLSFKVRPHNISSITSLRVDLEVNIVTSTFDTNYTSYTLAVASMTNGDGKWTNIEIPLSYFPIKEEWVGFNSELIPFANTLFYYGIRFVLEGVDISSVSIDDVRIVYKGNDQPIDFYRFTKLFSLETKQDKNFGSMLLTMRKPSDSTFNIDIYNNFGARSRSLKVDRSAQKEIVIVNYSSGSIAKLDSRDLSLKDEVAIGTSAYQFYHAVMSDKYIWIPNRTDSSIWKLARNSFGTFISSYGSFGSGSNQFNTVHQLSRDGDNIYMVDLTNQRVKMHSEYDFAFVRSFGSLGSSTNTNKLHQPTGIAVDENNLAVVDEGNYRLMRVNKSTMGYISQTPLYYNTFGETSIVRDEKFDYLCYRSGDLYKFDSTDVIIEKRDKNNGRVSVRKICRPKGSTASAFYGNRGDIALLGDYLFVIFNNDDENSTNATHYLQKYHKDDLTFIDERIFANSNLHSVIGDSLSFKPSSKIELIDLKSEGKYIQLKYYSDGELDNSVTLFNQTFLVSPKTQGY